MRTASRFLAALLITTQLAYAQAPAPASKSSDTSTYELLNLFGEVFDRVRSDYVEPVEDQKLIESALNGMLTSLDPHSNYMNEKQFNDMKIQTKGEFGGLGIEVTMENGLVKVVSPIDDTPASKAGVKPGDYISEIDNVAVMGLTLQEAVDKMRGAVGSNVKITILREGSERTAADQYQARPHQDPVGEIPFGGRCDLPAHHVLLGEHGRRDESRVR